MPYWVAVCCHGAVMRPTEGIVHFVIQRYRLSACRHLQLSTLKEQCTGLQAFISTSAESQCIQRLAPKAYADTHQIHKERMAGCQCQMTSSRWGKWCRAQMGCGRLQRTTHILSISTLLLYSGPQSLLAEPGVGPTAATVGRNIARIPYTAESHCTVGDQSAAEAMHRPGFAQSCLEA